MDLEEEASLKNVKELDCGDKLPHLWYYGAPGQGPEKAEKRVILSKKKNVLPVRIHNTNQYTNGTDGKCWVRFRIIRVLECMVLLESR